VKRRDGPTEDDAPDPPLKERVIHTRVSAALDDALRRFASSMRVPVSNAIRVLLEDAVSVAQRATDRVSEAADEAARAADSASRAHRRPRRDALAGIFGFQPLTLAIDATCARCGTELAAGEDAYMGVRDTGIAGPRVFVCEGCLPKPKRKERTR